jgi:hypothetical protein
MADYTSGIAAKQTQALVKGPPAGSPGSESARRVYSYQDAVTPTATVANTDRLRFGLLPAGAQIIPGSTWLSSSLAAIAGKIQFTPLDGSAVTELTGVSVTQDSSTAAKSIPSGVEIPVLAKPSWVDFVPTASAALTGVTVRARIEYSLGN